MNERGGLVQRLWSYCNVLRDDGLSYGDYLEQLTYLLFLKMADEQTRPPFSRPSVVPEGLDWPSLLERDGDELEVHYRHVLTELGRNPGMLGVVFRKAQNRIQDPAKLRRIVVDLIDRESWLTLDVDVKGDAASASVTNVSFAEGDAKALAFEDAEFDMAVFHTTLCHIPGPSDVLDEAHRVLRPGGSLVVFDGDYAASTVALNDHDPLQQCVDAAMAAYCHDPWLVRRLPSMISGSGFVVERVDGHGYVSTSEAEYMLTLVDRGADVLAADRVVDTDRAEALKAEARDRIADRSFYGSIPFASVIARKP